MFPQLTKWHCHLAPCCAQKLWVVHVSSLSLLLIQSHFCVRLTTSLPPLYCKPPLSYMDCCKNLLTSFPSILASLQSTLYVATSSSPRGLPHTEWHSTYSVSSSLTLLLCVFLASPSARSIHYSSSPPLEWRSLESRLCFICVRLYL